LIQNSKHVTRSYARGQRYKKSRGPTPHRMPHRKSHRCKPDHHDKTHHANKKQSVDTWIHL